VHGTLEQSPPCSSRTSRATGLEYRPDDPVIVTVVRRERRLSVTDGAAAVMRAGRPPGWEGAAERLAREYDVNVKRDGAVWLPVVPAGPGLDEIVRRIGLASLALYQDVLELSES
jgi:hypothetical protein